MASEAQEFKWISCVIREEDREIPRKPKRVRIAGVKRDNRPVKLRNFKVLHKGLVTTARKLRLQGPHIKSSTEIFESLSKNFYKRLKQRRKLSKLKRRMPNAFV